MLFSSLLLMPLLFISMMALGSMYQQISGRLVKRTAQEITLKSKNKVYKIQFSEIKNKRERKRMKKTLLGKNVILYFPISQKIKTHYKGKRNQGGER